MADWYYARGGTHQGPITSAQLKQMAQSGEIKPDDLVFQEGGKEWVAASTVKGLFAPPSSAPAPRAGVSAGPVDRSPEPVPARAAGGGQSGYWMDLLMFRRMIAPWIIQAMFWISSGLAVLATFILLIIGLFALAQNGIQGLGIMVLAVVALPINLLIIRLYCETMILFFRMNESLTDIKDALVRESKGKG